MTKIIYLNESLVAVFKEAGVSSQSEASGKGGLDSILKEELGKEVFPVHRLDRETSGIMIYALSADAAAKLSASFREGAVHKEYMAVLSSDPGESGVMRDFLLHDAKKNISRTVSPETPGAKEAVLTYSLIRKKSGLFLVSVKLLTGRTHQIRVQFASRKMPLVGDTRYKGIKAPVLALAAMSISFPSPDSGKEISLSLPLLPDSFPWTVFGEK